MNDELSARRSEPSGLPGNVGPAGGPIGPKLKAESFEVESMSLSRKHWNRLKTEAREAKMGWTELWLGAAFTFVGLAGAAAIALIALPTPDGSDPHASQLSSATRTDLRLGAIFSVIIAAVCLVAWLGKRRDHNASLDRLVQNMESNEHEGKPPAEGVAGAR